MERFFRMASLVLAPGTAVFPPSACVIVLASKSKGRQRRGRLPWEPGPIYPSVARPDLHLADHEVFTNELAHSSVLVTVFVVLVGAVLEKAEDLDLVALCGRGRRILPGRRSRSTAAVYRRIRRRQR